MQKVVYIHFTRQCKSTIPLKNIIGFDSTNIDELENHLAVFKPGFPLNDKLSHEVEFHDFLSTLDPEFTGITVSSTTSFREWCLAQEGGKYISPWESGTPKAE